MAASKNFCVPHFCVVLFGVAGPGVSVPGPSHFPPGSVPLRGHQLLLCTTSSEACTGAPRAADKVPTEVTLVFGALAASVSSAVTFPLEVSPHH